MRRHPSVWLSIIDWNSWRQSGNKQCQGDTQTWFLFTKYEISLPYIQLLDTNVFKKININQLNVLTSIFGYTTVQIAWFIPFYFPLELHCHLMSLLCVSDGYNPKRRSHRSMLLCLLMTSCDLSDQTKGWKTTRKIAVSWSPYLCVCCVFEVHP